MSESDPLLDFLLTRDRRKVMAEAVNVPLERLYAEASVEDRELIDVLPVGVVRRRLMQAEVLLASREEREVRVVGSGELLTLLRRQRAENEKLKRSNQELRDILYEKNGKEAA
ncbi:hypothetical protein [Leucobacter sp. NPDC077196]|uniref:hypothetical protein n=1 Tax=Leucobacter sp. NPDC077196 TaxID=3154959 RepID=UPI0034214CC0